MDDKQLQEELAQYRTAQQQLQIISQQKFQSDLQLKETKSALDELRTAPTGADVFKAVGRILIKSGIDDVKKDLNEESETLDVRIKSLEKQEGKLRDKLQEMEKGLEAKLKKKNN